MMSAVVIMKGPFLRGRGPLRFVAMLVFALCPLTTALGQTETDEVSSPWSGSVSVRAMSRLSEYGLDAAPERVTYLVGGSVEHEWGVTMSLSAALQPDPWTAQRTSLSGEYEFTLSEPWTLGLSLTRSWYPAGSTNPLASSPTSAGLALSYDGELWSFGADLDRYFGGEGATYASVDASVFLAADGFSVLPIASVSFGSQTVAASSLKRNGKGRNTSGIATATTVTGVSSVEGMVVLIIPLGDGWSVSAMPGLMMTPSDLASASTRFTWSVGLRKAL